MNQRVDPIDRDAMRLKLWVDCVLVDDRSFSVGFQWFPRRF